MKMRMNTGALNFRPRWVSSDCNRGRTRATAALERGLKGTALKIFGVKAKARHEMINWERVIN